MLRGLALFSMFVAHMAPGPGPGAILDYSEYVTAPLFAMLIGMGAQRSAEGSSNLVSAFVRAGIRAAVLVALSLWLTTWGAQVDIVLIYLALPTLLAPVLARFPSTVLWVLGGVGWLATHTALTAFATDRADALVRHDQLGVWLWDVTFTGMHYRGIEMLAYLCAGILTARSLRHDEVTRPVFAAGGVALMAVGIGIELLGRTGRLAAAEYSGTRPAIAVALCLIVGFTWLWFAVVPKHLTFSPLAIAGSMSLSVYVLQIAYLAWYVTQYRPGAGDDTWPNLALVTVGTFAAAWLWRTQIRNERLRPGPIEGPVGVITGIFR